MTHRVTFHPSGGGMLSTRRYYATRHRLRVGSRRGYSWRGDCISQTADGTFWVWGLGLAFDDVSEAMAAIEGQHERTRQRGLVREILTQDAEIFRKLSRR